MTLIDHGGALVQIVSGSLSRQQETALVAEFLGGVVEAQGNGLYKIRFPSEGDEYWLPPYTTALWRRLVYVALMQE
jgi:hypothetical protein